MAYNLSFPVVTERYFYVVLGMLLYLEPTDVVKGISGQRATVTSGTINIG